MIGSVNEEEVRRLCSAARRVVLLIQVCGDRGSSVVKVLCYKSEGGWFDPNWCYWNFSLT